MNSERKIEIFNTIISEYQGRLANLCMMFYKEEQEDRKDMLQDVLVCIWENLDSYRGECALWTWVYRVAINVGNQKMRCKSHHPIAEELTPNMTAIQLNSDYTEKLETLYQLAQYLSKRDQEILSMSLTLKNYAEVATVLNLSEGYVKNRMKQIKDQIKTIYNNEKNI